MEQSKRNLVSRRSFLWRMIVVPAGFVLAACSGRTLDDVLSGMPGGQPTTPDTPTAQLGESLPPTPSCEDDDDLTLAQTEGPYFTPNSPERATLLEPGITGTRIVLAGYVLTTDCQPVLRALVDFWHADEAGVYDNVGYKLRGHQFTDDSGHYTLESIVPGLYPGRTRHFHVKVQAPYQPVLTTQLYFPGEPANASDGIYNPALEITVQAADNGQQAAFNFVLNISG